MRFISKHQWRREQGGSDRIYFGILSIIFGIVTMLCTNWGLVLGIAFIGFGIVLIVWKILTIRRLVKKAVEEQQNEAVTSLPVDQNINKQEIDHPNEDISIVNKRFHQIAKVITFTATFLQKFKIPIDFSLIQDEVTECVIKELSIYEFVFKDQLYDENNEHMQQILDGQKMYAVSFGLCKILQLSDDSLTIDREDTDIYQETEKVLSQSIQQHNESIYSMSLSELRQFFLESIKNNLTEELSEETSCRS